MQDYIVIPAARDRDRDRDRERERDSIHIREHNIDMGIAHAAHSTHSERKRKRRPSSSACASMHTSISVYSAGVCVQGRWRTGAGCSRRVREILPPLHTHTPNQNTNETRVRSQPGRDYGAILTEQRIRCDIYGAG
jgi:hypothetical protein